MHAIILYECKGNANIAYIHVSLEYKGISRKAHSAALIFSIPVM